MTEKPSNPKDAVGIRKAPMSTVPATVLAEIGVGMLEGALKYGRHNYRAVGVRASVYYDATMRHMRDWWEGEDMDPDVPLSHITKALCSLVVLRDAMIQGMLTDDRPPPAPVASHRAALQAVVGGLIEKYPEPKAPFTRLDPRPVEVGFPPGAFRPSDDMIRSAKAELSRVGVDLDALADDEQRSWLEDRQP